jgi:hypothetical protein
MAVELAKVSLWLDAFTLGAPLNFLDHHLRCGNSLIGAAFRDLEDAVTPRVSNSERWVATMFGLDYEPLLRAINYVLFVSKIADATAAEVTQSQSRYGEARRALAGYRLVLDLLVAQHFGLPAAAGLVKAGKDLDLTDAHKFAASLADDKERRLVAEVAALAHRPDLRFFHWEVEFPEVFFGLRPGTQDRLEHRDRIHKGSAGFDCVVGNPPYVRQEVVRPLKQYFKTRFKTYDSANDLYVYFQEVEVRNLRVGGRMGMIVANKWMRSGYGKKIREFLRRCGQPLEIIDFGHSPIFPDADTFPCILIVGRRSRPLAENERTPDGEVMSASEVPREKWSERIPLAPLVASRRVRIPTSLLRKEGWSLEYPASLVLLEKIRNERVPLRSYLRHGPLMGIKTGLNEAFVVDSSTRRDLVAKDSQSESVTRSLLRGRDIDRWRSADSGTYLVTIPSSENVDWPWSDAGSKAENVFRKEFPAIYDHLLPFRDALIQRQDQGRYWWELRSCDYMDQFERPKIVWQEMAWFARFSLEKDGRVLNNTGYILPSTDPVVVAVLNSPLAWWYMWRTAQHGKDEVLRLIYSYIAEFPLPECLDSRFQEAFASAVCALSDAMNTVHSFAEEMEIESEQHFGADASDKKIASWLSFPAESFASRLLKVEGSKQPGARLREELALFQQRCRRRQIELLSRVLDFEKKVAALVEDAYGLSQEERALLRSTRPARDPIDVLERKIRGGVVDEAPHQH